MGGLHASVSLVWQSHKRIGPFIGRLCPSVPHGEGNKWAVQMLFMYVPSMIALLA
jgi:hypothetical protein